MAHCSVADKPQAAAGVRLKNTLEPVRTQLAEMQEEGGRTKKI